MHLVDNNENGRIYIKKFEIEKEAFIFVEQNFVNVNCYLVNFDENIVTLYIKKPNGLDYNKLKEVQEATLDFLKNNIGVYVSRVDVEIK